ncbi:hypothetical protein D3C79_1025440 [compost metagenome]
MTRWVCASTFSAVAVCCAALRPASATVLADRAFCLVITAMAEVRRWLWVSSNAEREASTVDTAPLSVWVAAVNAGATTVS